MSDVRLDGVATVIDRRGVKPEATKTTQQMAFHKMTQHGNKQRVGCTSGFLPAGMLSG